MRTLVASELLSYLKNHPLEIENIAVVGGSSQDYEVAQISRILPLAKFHYFGIENPHNDENFIYLDLNLKSKGLSSLKYGLVICSQVLEHLWKLETAFETLVLLTSQEGGLIWINCPASNLPHGSPEYFSAGYSTEFLTKNLVQLGLNIVSSGYYGSKRYHFMTHILRFWATEKEHRHPLLGYNFQPGTRLGVLNKLRRDIPGRLMSTAINKNIRHDVEYATESYVLAQYT